MPEPSNSQRALTGTMSSKDQAQHQAVQDSRLASNRIVTDEEVRAARRFLRNSAKDVGQARARYIKAGHMVKHVEALAALHSSEKSAEARKMDARASAKYLEAIEEEANAGGAIEELKALREAAMMDVELWRSEQASLRTLR